jgi:hypothetical protein
VNKWVFGLIVLACLLKGNGNARIQSDINNDGRVDLADFAILASEWLIEETDMRLGTQLVTNGTFTNTDSWTADVPLNFTVADNKATLATDGNIYQSISGLLIGKKYRVSFTVTDFPEPEEEGDNTKVSASFSGTSIPITGNGNYQRDIVFDGSHSLIYFGIESEPTSGIITISNVSIQEMLPLSYLKSNGVDGALRIPTNAALNFGTANFSICFWMMCSHGQYVVLFKGTDDAYFEAMQCTAKYDSGVIFLQIKLTNEFSANAIATKNVSLSSGLHHIAFTVDRSGNWIIYVDGIAQYTIDNSADSTINADNSNALLLQKVLGSDYEDGRYFTEGSIDNLRFYKAALTPTEIGNIYNAGIPLEYNSDQTPVSGAACFVMEFDDDFVSNEIFSTVPSGGNKLTGTRSGGVTTWAGSMLPVLEVNSEHFTSVMNGAKFGDGY